MRILHDRPSQRTDPSRLLAVVLAGAVVGATVSTPCLADPPAAWTVLGPQMWSPSRLQEPVAVAPLPDRDLAVLDGGRRRILTVAEDGTILHGFGKRGTKSGEFRSPADVAADAEGFLYVTDPETFRLQKLSQEGEVVWSVLCTEGERPLRLESVAVGVDGSIYAVEPAQAKVHRLDQSGHRTGGWGTPGAGHGEFRSPAGIAVDGSGRIAVADRENGRVQVFDPEGSFLTEWLLPLTATGQTLQPLDVAFFEDGRVAVLIAMPEPEVLILGASGEIVQRWGSTGTGRYGLRTPQGLAVTAQGRVLVADTRNARIQQYDLERMQSVATEDELEAIARGGVPRFGVRYQALVPLIEGPPAGFTDRLHLLGRVRPDVALELGFATATSTEKDESIFGGPFGDDSDRIFGNVYVGVVLGNPLGDWSGRAGLRLPWADDGEVEARAVAYLADPRNRIAFHPSAFGATGSVERVMNATPTWRVIFRGGMEYFTNTEDSHDDSRLFPASGYGFGGWVPADQASEMWFFYGAEYVRDFGWCRARGGLAGQLAPISDLSPRDSRYEQMAVYDSTGVTFKRVRVDNPLSELQNQLYLNVDFLRDTVRPGIEVRWWIEDRTREYVSWVLGFYLDYAYTMP